MKRNSEIFGVLCCFMVVAIVSSELTEVQPTRLDAASTDYKKVWTGVSSAP